MGSSDLITSSKFFFMKKTESQEAVVEDNKARKKRLKHEGSEKEKTAFGTYAGDMGSTFTYRVRKAGAYGSWKIITERTKGKSREDLLEMRCKKKADRHCNC